MPDKESPPIGNDSALGVLCARLGQIPAGSQTFSNSVIPTNWVSFSDVDWAQLVARAQSEGLAPLMYWVISKSGWFSSIPESLRERLRLDYVVTQLQNQSICKELDSLVRALNQARIPVVVLKGVCFALTLYPDIGLRPMGDLDVLVPSSRLTEAVQIARLLGYGNASPDASPGLRDLLNHEICLQKAGSQSITLEIHHSLVADRSFRYAVPVDWFWEQVVPLNTASLEANGLQLFMLSPTAQMLYAAAHAMLQHGGTNAPLRWFYDLDRLVRTYSDRLDWDLLVSQARIFEWGSALEAALDRTQAWFKTPIPGNVLAVLSGQVDRNRQLVARKQVRPPTHILEELQKMLSLNWYGRIRLLAALIAPSPAYMRWRYQLKTSWAIPAFYGLRWGGILMDGFRSLASLFKKGPPNTHLD